MIEVILMHEQMIKDYVNGMTYKQLQEKYYTTNIARYIPDELKRGKCIKHREEIRDRYLQGETIESLVKRYKVSRASVRHILKGYNIKIRKVRKVE